MPLAAPWELTRADDPAASAFHVSQPGFSFRICNSPDSKRVVACWLLSNDLQRKIPNRGWLTPNSPTPPPYEIRSVESKGRGMFATRAIKSGEVILNERPVIMVPRELPVDTRDPYIWCESYLLQCLYVLEQEDRVKVVQLHNCKPLDRFGPIFGVLQTNAVGLNLDGAEYASICLTISYVNHSCVPNAKYSYDVGSVVVSLSAAKDIAPGEEINLNYIDSSLSLRAERKALLRTMYGFTCACPLCDATPSARAASDERRKLIRKTLPMVETSFDEWDKLSLKSRSKVPEAKRILKTLEALFRAVDEERFHDSRVSRAYFVIIHLFAAFGDVSNFKRFARKALGEVNEGEDTDTARVHKPLLEDWLKDQTLHAGWNCLRQ